jgi:putative membrane protein
MSIKPQLLLQAKSLVCGRLMRGRMTPAMGAACLTAGSATPVRADIGARLSPQEVWTAWDFDPLVLFTLIVAGGLYQRGWTELRRRTGSHRKLSLVHALSFYAALLFIGMALLSPLDALGQELSAAHMVQHMLLMLVAAPLMVVGVPALVLAFAMPRIWRQLLGLQWLVHRIAWHPLVLWWLFALVLWGWHHPLLYQAALRDPLVHDAQHVCFFVASFLFWRVVLDPLSRRRLHPVAAIPYLFTTSIHASALGIFLTLAPTPWYGDYAQRTVAFGATPLADQQLAGLLMWAPGCMVYPLAMVILLAHWLAQSGDQGSTPAHPRGQLTLPPTFTSKHLGAVRQQ